MPSPITCKQAPLPAGAPGRLADLMALVDAAKQRSIIQHMSKHLIPIMEKGLVDCPLVHRYPPHHRHLWWLWAAAGLLLPTAVASWFYLGGPLHAMNLLQGDSPHTPLFFISPRISQSGSGALPCPTGCSASSWNSLLPRLWPMPQRICQATPCCTWCTPR